MAETDEIDEILRHDESLPDVQMDLGSSAPKKRCYSTAWDTFEKFEVDGKQKAKCMRCGIVYQVDGTKNLIDHASTRCPFRNTSAELLEANTQPFDNDVSRRMLSKCVIMHNLPYKYVEYEAVRERDAYLNPKVKPISRNTCKDDVLKVYEEEKVKLKRVLASLTSRICLTSDLWTSTSEDGYIVLTAHFVDQNWVLQKALLCFRKMPTPHDANSVGVKIISFMREWGIEKKIFTLTLDNASYNSLMVESSLKTFFESNNSLVCGGDFLHVRCAAHILNLIVKAGFKTIEAAIKKIRESVKYLRGSQTKAEKFAECVKRLELPARKLRQDCNTRWNSLFYMLKSALPYRAAFRQFRVVDSDYIWCPLPEEWTRVEIITRFLEPFAEMTDLFSGAKYPTANLYFLNVWTIHVMLITEMQSSDPVIKAMATQMKPKFDKYWKHYSPILSMAVVLDPRYKMNLIQYAYRQVYPNPIDQENELKAQLVRLFELYLHPSRTSTTETSLSVEVPSMRLQSDLLAGFDVHENQRGVRSTESQLELYLADPLLDRIKNKKLDVLKYWKHSKYKELAKMARDVLSIPITSVSSESAFSQGGRLFGKYRHNILPENAEANLCSRDWLGGSAYHVEEEGEDLTLDIEKLLPLASPSVQPRGC